MIIVIPGNGGFTLLRIPPNHPPLRGEELFNVHRRQSQLVFFSPPDGRGGDQQLLAEPRLAAADVRYRGFINLYLSTHG